MLENWPTTGHVPSTCSFTGPTSCRTYRITIPFNSLWAVTTHNNINMLILHCKARKIKRCWEDGLYRHIFHAKYPPIIVLVRNEFKKSVVAMPLSDWVPVSQDSTCSFHIAAVQYDIYLCKPFFKCLTVDITPNTTHSTGPMLHN